MKRLENLIKEFGESTDPNERYTIAEQIITLAKEQNYVTPLTPMTMEDPDTGADIDVTEGLLPLPAYSRANTERNLLEEAIGR